LPHGGPANYHSRVFRTPAWGRFSGPGRGAMIENFAPETESGEARIVVRPNRSLSMRQVVGVSLGFAAVAALVSVMSWLQGNSFAPLFALLVAAVFGGSLYAVWLRGGRAESIAVDAERVRVRRLPELQDVFEARRVWVRLDTSAGKVVIYSGTNRVEVGGCLGEAERALLARRLADLLRWDVAAADAVAAGGAP